MLERIRIRDLALVEEADVEFGAGLNVVTGETGAGKSLLVQAIHLLVGGRADSEVVRDGASATVVEGEFQVEAEIARRVAELLASWSVEFDGGTVIVRREVQAGGRSRASVNQSPVTLAALKRLGEILADLHGQHEHQSLLRPDAGIEVLDRLAALGDERARYADALAAFREAASERERVETSLATYDQRRDFLLQAAQDLDQARLASGEEDTLRIEAARLQYSDRLRQLVSDAVDRLSEGETSASDSIAASARALDQAAALDPSLEAARATLEETRIAAAETARQLAEYSGKLEADPQALEAIEARRESIARLTRKYRRSVGELLAWREELRVELESGEDAQGTLERVREKLALAEVECRARAADLTRRRRAAAAEWSTKVTRDLKPLGMAGARIEFMVEPFDPGEARFAAYGLDQVSIRFGANPGEPPRALQKIASGGELSRVMLALKTALETQDRVDVLLFDEVDSGIGGAVAHAVGERLRRLARHRQIICVTHLPMIAALASHHLRVEKQSVSGRTRARIESARGEARIIELARMLAGDRATTTTLRQARELLGSPETRAAR
ncbi:MAG: DNA repair protein RecN [Candidatus Eisenbacteria bacterium]|nr:DNA repair protein RecN [Candidatus Eisenbacteria bacterium]